MKTQYFVAGLAMAGLVAATPAVLAGSGHDHEGAKHEHSKTDVAHGAKHGGQFQEVNDHHGVEMVVSGASVVFHMTHEHQPNDMTGASFKAVVQSQAGTSTVALTPDGSALKGNLPNSPAKGAKIALTGKDGHGDVIQARFVMK